MKFKAFWLDRSGDVAALFGLATLALFVMIGGGLELSRTQQTSNETAVAADHALQAQVKQATPLIASASNAGVNLEVSLMLDVTGSMAGEKISALKEAAQDLVSVVVWDDQSTYTSRVALVPFAENVRLARSAQTKATGAQPVTFTKDVTKWHWYHGWQSVSETYYTTDCLAERTGSQAFTDAPPGEEAYVTTVAAGKPSARCDQGAGNVITPLTNNKLSLNTAINNVSLEGNAAGHLGTAWAWYTLSPRWNSIWASADNQASAYGAAKTQKIAILMSDGAYNTQYLADGVQSTTSDAANGSSTDQARALCTAMKKTGILVYTIGFDLSDGSATDTTLSHCASDASKAFSAEDGKDLKRVFRSIALEITKLNVSS